MSTNPTYKQVCGGDTGHAEAIRVTFDPDQVSYGDLLDIFFATHDPTQLNRQGNDVGTQYRSAIFPHDARAGGRGAARRSTRNAENWPAPIVTTIEPMATWYPAEDYHQEYWDGEGQRNPYCLAVIPPKLQKLRKSFAARSKAVDRGRLTMRGAAQAIVDRRADAVVGDRRDGDRRAVARVGAVERVEQAARRLR